MRLVALLVVSLGFITGCISDEPEQLKQPEVVPQPELAAAAQAPAAEAAAVPAQVPTDLGGMQAQAQAPVTEATSSVPAEVQAEAPKVEPAPAPIVEAAPVQDPNQLTMISRRADEAPAAAPFVAYELQVVASGLNVRSEPSMRATVVRTLPRGSRVKGTNREGIWIQIGENEYVSIIYLKEIAPLKESENLGAARN